MKNILFVLVLILFRLPFFILPLWLIWAKVTDAYEFSGWWILLALVLLILVASPSEKDGGK